MSYQQLTTQHYNMLGGINQKTSEYTTGENQFLRIFNLDGFVPNALVSRPGWTAFGLIGASQPINNIFEYEKFSGFSEIVVSSGGYVYGFSTNGSVKVIQQPSALANNVYDFLTFNDTLYAASGVTFVQYNGTSTYSYGVPPIRAFPTPSLVGTGNGFSFGATTFITYQARLVDIFGQEAAGGAGLTWDSTAIVVKSPGNGISSIYVPDLPADTSGFSDIGQFGFSSIRMYRAVVNIGSGGAPPQPFSEYKFLTQIAFGTTFFRDTWGTTSMILQDSPPNLFPFLYSINGFGSYITANRIPRFVEIFNNTLFMSGFTATPSVAWHSEIGKPGEIQAEYNFEVRTDDGDKIYAMRQYNDQLLFFKFNSFHKIIGNDPDNFELIQVSSEFGCLSDRAVVEAYENLYFLDKKGVVQYNGSSYFLISDALEETFRRMNVANATNNAVATYDQYRNQLWFSFPIDNSTQNNRTAVYDLITESWYEFEGYNPSGYGRVTSFLNRDYVFFGNYSGYMGWFSPTFVSDFGQAFTQMFFTRFDSPLGQNVEKVFRRNYVDVVPGASRAINLEIFRNYNMTEVMATYISDTTQYQTRHEMGVNGRACAMQISYLSASFPIQFNGYALTYRYLRDI